jgi:hypothetical protein
VLLLPQQGASKVVFSGAGADTHTPAAPGAWLMAVLVLVLVLGRSELGFFCVRCAVYVHVSTCVWCVVRDIYAICIEDICPKASGKWGANFFCVF